MSARRPSASPRTCANIDSANKLGATPRAALVGSRDAAGSGTLKSRSAPQQPGQQATPRRRGGLLNQKDATEAAKRAAELNKDKVDEEEKTRTQETKLAQEMAAEAAAAAPRAAPARRIWVATLHRIGPAGLPCAALAGV